MFNNLIQLFLQGRFDVIQAVHPRTWRWYFTCWSWAKVHISDESSYQHKEFDFNKHLLVMSPSLCLLAAKWSEWFYESASCLALWIVWAIKQSSDHAGMKNTDQNTFQLRSELILKLIKKSNGTWCLQFSKYYCVSIWCNVIYLKHFIHCLMFLTLLL